MPRSLAGLLMMGPMIFASVAALAAEPSAGSFKAVRVLGSERFLHDAKVHALLPLGAEVRTVAGGHIWRWSRAGKLLAKRRLVGCGGHHGVGVGVFSSDGRWLLAYCGAKTRHALYDPRGKRMAWVDDFGLRPLYCGGRFYGHRSLVREGLRALDPTTRKVRTLRPGTGLEAKACLSGHLAILPSSLHDGGGLLLLDAKGGALARHAGRFVRLGPGAGALAVVSSHATELMLADRRGVRPTGIALASSYLEVPGWVALPQPQRVVTRHHRYARVPGRARIATSKGRVIVDTVPNVRGVVFDAKQLWTISGWRVDAYRLDDGGSTTAAPQNRSVAYHEGRIVMASARRLWSKVGREWAAFDVDSGKLLRRARRLADLTKADRELLGARARARAALDKAGASRFARARLLRAEEVWALPELAHTVVRRLDLRSKQLSSHDLGPKWFWARDAAATGSETLLVGFDTPFRQIGGRLRRNRAKQGIRLWQLGKGSVAWRPPPKGVELLEATRIGFVPKTREVWITTARGNRILIFDAGLKALVWQRTLGEAAGQGMAMAFSPDGRAFAVQLENGRIHVFRRPGPARGPGARR